MILGLLAPATAQETPAPAPAPAPAAAPETPAPAPAGPTLEERVGDLEHYFGVGSRSGSSKLAGAVGPGHTAWILTSSALVLFMTLPGLALFYGGLVRSKNVLSVMAQCLGCAAWVTVLWWACGYSLAFGGSFDSPFLGGTEHLFLAGLLNAPSGNFMVWVPDSVFCCFQLMFAIITPGLIVGAIAERMKYSAIMLFITAWMFLVYFPLAHMVWGPDGFMNGPFATDMTAIKAIDFAGGAVVHMSSGWSALVLCIILGPRTGYGKAPMVPHSMVLCMIGTGMLWVGWYGFNAGSAGGADGIAANAFLTTTLAAAFASFTWAALEWIMKGKPSILGFCSGVVGGLVAITPAAGFVTATGAVILGVLGGALPFFACTKLKPLLGYDDALDTFGVHGVGGTIGALALGFLASKEVNPGIAGLVDGGGLPTAQILSILLTVTLSVVATAIIAFAIKATIGLRPSIEDETTGLDITDHGEAGYEMESHS
ncbi:ammonia channel protein [Verrucomicrobia bacterium LW23]|nr:ammonia channel protein [Verrucomicrobia bacterium LW23]